MLRKRNNATRYVSAYAENAYTKQRKQRNAKRAESFARESIDGQSRDIAQLARFESLADESPEILAAMQALRQSIAEFSQRCPKLAAKAQQRAQEITNNALPIAQRFPAGMSIKQIERIRAKLRAIDSEN